MIPEFDTGHPELAVVDAARFAELGPRKAREECDRIARSLHVTGMAIVWPEGAEQQSSLMDATGLVFGDLFGMSAAHLTQQYERPALGRQVGYTPTRIERARPYDRVLERFTAEIPPELYPVCGGRGEDANENARWFHRWGPRPDPSETAFGGLNAPNVIPSEVDGFEDCADGFGAFMDGVCTRGYEMLEIGLGLPEGELRGRRKKAPHLVAPTHIDLARCGLSHRAPIRTHGDLNGLTAHLAATRGGLVGYLRDGTPFRPNLPPGFVLLQAGNQLAGLTGGYILPGLHQVMVPLELLPLIIEAIRRKERFDRVGRIWFDHFDSDAQGFFEYAQV